MPTGGDCMATGSVAKPNEEQPKRLPYNLAGDDMGCTVRCPQWENDETNGLGTERATSAASHCSVNR